jgi:hypothetical protein
LYKRDSLRITRYRRLGGSDPDLNLIHASWEQSLRRAVEQLPEIKFEDPPEAVRSEDPLGLSEVAPQAVRAGDDAAQAPGTLRSSEPQPVVRS